MGCDKLPLKIIIPGATILCTYFAMLINICIEKSFFSSKLKFAEITLVYKKGDIYDKGNYWPVSLLPCISQVFEGVQIGQLQCHFNPLLSYHMPRI